MPVTIFICYSHVDEDIKNQVVKYLHTSGEKTEIDIWDDSRIKIGTYWQEEIEKAINKANIAVLLVSVDFLNSNFIQNHEIPAFLDRRQKNGIHIIPFIIRPCLWQTYIPWLNEIQARPKGIKALNQFPRAKQDNILNEFASEVRSILMNQNKESTPQPNSGKKTNLSSRQARLQEQKAEDEKSYIYLARRFGMGYRLFNVKCEIEPDGSAVVVRTVELEAYSTVGEIDTVMNIPDVDPDGRFREIALGKIQTDDDYNLTLGQFDKKPGLINAKIHIKPPLKRSRKLTYHVSDYYLPKGLFAINLDQDEYLKRNKLNDYFGWHLTRPNRRLILQVKFPFGSCPKKYWHEVKYASSTALPGNEVLQGEQKRLKGPRHDEKDFDTLIIEVDYPLYGLVYILGWIPLGHEQ